MPKRVVTYYFQEGSNPYQSDAGFQFSIPARFQAPPDLSEAAVDAIITAAGGTRGSLQVPCSDRGVFSARRLYFIRTNGNSFSVAFNSRANVVSVAQTIRDIVNASNVNVACIKLEGEEFLNLNDELGVDYNETTQSHRAPATSAKQNYATGLIEYTLDTGRTDFQPVKTITESEGNNPPAKLGSTWSGCAGTFNDTLLACRGRRRNPLDHRRYILTTNTNLTVDLDGSGTVPDSTEPPGSELNEVPVAANTAAEILSCGQALAALRGVYCIGYQGESYDRIHKLVEQVV